jgi:purine-binding chemotaxis protein CheW
MSETKAMELGAERAVGAAPLMLVFAIGPCLFGLPLDSVREVIRVPPITPIPRGPANVVGVSLAGGAVITIFDLRIAFGFPLRPQSEHSRVLLVRQPGEVVGLVVEQVLGVRELEAPGESMAGPLAASADAPRLLDPDALFSTA